MLSSLIVSLTICATTIEAPQLPPWPSGLPDPIETDAGTLLPPELAEAVNYQREACKVLPYRCKVRIEAQRDLCAITAEERERTWWHPLAFFASGIAGGMVIGALAVMLAD